MMARTGRTPLAYAYEPHVVASSMPLTAGDGRPPRRTRGRLGPLGTWWGRLGDLEGDFEFELANTESAEIRRLAIAVRVALATAIPDGGLLTAAVRQELLAEQHAVTGMWVTYKQLNRGGLKKAQESVRSLYEYVTLMRAYSTKVIPGLLQTRAYTTAALEAVRAEHGVEVDDVAEAVAERMNRQNALKRPDTRFVFLLEEHVLWHRTTHPATHAEQLRHLLETMRLPSVLLGIVPLATDRTTSGARRVAGGGIHHHRHRTGERGAGLRLPDDLPAGRDRHVPAAWDRLRALAVSGKQARQLILRTIEAVENN